MKKNILLIGDPIVDEFLPDLCMIKSDYKVSHIYALNINSIHQKLIEKNNIEVIYGFHNYTELKLTEFDDQTIENENLNIEKFNSIKSLYRFFDNRDFFSNEAIYYELCNYWISFFKNNNIDLIISPRPSSLETLPVIIAKNFFEIKILTRMGLLRNLTKGTWQNCIMDESNKKFINFNIEKHLEIQELLFTKNRIKRKFSIPRFYKIILKNLFNLKISSVLQNLSSLFYFFEFKKYLKKNCVDPNLNKKYIFYSMHFDPESTTTPYEDVAANQLLNIRKLSCAMPEDWEVYVKFHPAQINYKFNFTPYECYGNVLTFFKSTESIDYLTNLKNVKIIRTEYSQKKLIENSQAISAICGSVFLEASAMNMPIFVFGKKTIYNTFSNSFNSDSIEKIKSTLNNLMNEKNEIPRSNYESIMRGYTYSSGVKKIQIVNSILNYVRN